MKKLLGEKINFDWNIIVITVVSTLLLITDHYRQITDHKYYDRIILYLLIPLFFIIFVQRESPAQYGFTFGDWKIGILLTLIGIGATTPLMWFLGQSNPSMINYYKGLVGGLPWSTFLDLFGWEFLFRGWILFGYHKKFGADALWLQAVPFAMAHIGKPEIETLSTIFGGFVFGWVAWRTKSFVWPFLIHWFINTFIILVSSGRI